MSWLYGKAWYKQVLCHLPTDLLLSYSVAERTVLFTRLSFLATPMFSDIRLSLTRELLDVIPGLSAANEHMTWWSAYTD